MSQIIVGISDSRVSVDPASSLVTYALGSCIAIVAHDPAVKVGGMVHFMLPDSSIDAEKGRRNPCVFADTAIPALLRDMCSMGGQKRRLVVSVIGGAQVTGFNSEFNIGKNNYLAAKKVLWKSGVMIHAEQVGGCVARTVRLDVGSGKVFFRAPGDAEQELAAAIGGTYGVPRLDRR